MATAAAVEDAEDAAIAEEEDDADESAEDDADDTEEEVEADEEDDNEDGTADASIVPSAFFPDAAVAEDIAPSRDTSITLEGSLRDMPVSSFAMSQLCVASLFSTRSK